MCAYAFIATALCVSVGEGVDSVELGLTKPEDGAHAYTMPRSR